MPDVDTQNLPGVEDDDPTQTDTEDEREIPADDDLGEEADDLAGLLEEGTEDEADDDDDEGDKGDKSPAPAAKNAKPTAAPAAKPAEQAEPEDEQEPTDEPPADAPAKFTQADVERIIAQRLAHDRKTDVVQRVEAILGKPLEQFEAEARQNKIQDAQERYAMTEDEATNFVTQQEELVTLKAQQADLERRQQELQAITAYQQEKAKHQSNPLAQKYAEEVDAFTQYGKALSFEDGLAYILGQKALNGELTESAARGAEQKTLAAVQKRRQAAPETGGTAGTKPANTVSRLESTLAHNFGLTDKEWAESKAQAAKNRRQG